MATSNKTVFNELTETLKVLKEMTAYIPEERREILKKIAAAVQEDKKKYGAAQLIFICTHNSRRSQMAQVWMALFAYLDGLNIRSFSGGTEVTAFNSKAVSAMKDLGFRCDRDPDEENPRIHVRWSVEGGMDCFSKEFDHHTNPMEKFIAIMTCSQANESCPVIPGARKRIPLEYEDPKTSDGTGTESRVYHERALQIGAEMMLLAKYSKKK